MELYSLKEFPANYTQKVVEVLSAMSMTGMKKLSIVGSASIRSQIYAGDYDAIEKVVFTSAKDIEDKLRDVIKKLRSIDETYIGDIKIGEATDWAVFHPNSYVEDGKVHNFSVKESQTKIDELLSKNIISRKEAKDSLELLEDIKSPFDFLEAKKTIKFSTLRWKPINILNGYLHYRGHRFDLKDAIESGGILKLDVISNIGDRFTEFSIIYDLVNKKGQRLTNVPTNLIRSLQEDILYYNETDPFKAIKRMFALAKAERKYEVAKVLVPLLNSDLGRLYQIIGDLKTLLSLLERPHMDMKEIKDQIDETRDRFSNIYQLRNFLKDESNILGSINSILKSPKNVDVKLMKLISKLQYILNTATEKAVEHLNKDKLIGSGKYKREAKRIGDKMLDEYMEKHGSLTEEQADRINRLLLKIYNRFRKLENRKDKEGKKKFLSEVPELYKKFFDSLNK